MGEGEFADRPHLKMSSVAWYGSDAHASFFVAALNCRLAWVSLGVPSYPVLTFPTLALLAGCPAAPSAFAASLLHKMYLLDFTLGVGILGVGYFEVGR